MQGGEYSDYIADQLISVNDLVTKEKVLYEVTAELSPYAKCDYVIDLMASVKTLLCNMLIRGVILIQHACAIEGILLIFFVWLTTQGAKRWIPDAASSTTPVQIVVKEAQ